MMDAALQFQLMGGLAARRARSDGSTVELDLGGPQPRRVLAALLLSLGRPLPPDRLIELVWGDEPPASARGSLQAYISNLRRALEPDRAAGQAPTVLVLRPSGYQLAVDRSQLDTGAFEAAVAVDGHADAGQLAAALDGWAPLLPELAGAPFVRSAAEQLEGRRQAAFERLQHARLANGDHHDAIAELRAAVVADPRAERLWGLLAVARYRSGDAAAAVATVHQARTALAQLTGLDVGPDLRRLEADLLAQSADLDPPPSLRVAASTRTRPAVRRCGKRTTHRTSYANTPGRERWHTKFGRMAGDLG